MSKAIGVGWNLLSNDGFVKIPDTFKDIDLLILSASLAVIIHLHKTRPYLLSGLTNTVIKWFLVN